MGTGPFWKLLMVIFIPCINCQGSSAIRLSNGKHTDTGRVEVFHNGTWGTICDDGININFAKVVCGQLGYATDNVAVRFKAYYGEGDGPIWLDAVTCQGNETVIDMCMFSPWGEHNCVHGEDVGVTCGSGLIRLRNGKTQFEGRVEILHKGAWGTICDDGTSINFAKVVCRQLGYDTVNATVRPSAYFGAGSGQIWLDDVSCQGNEPEVDLCRYNSLGRHDCGHNEDVGVTCSSSAIRLSNGRHTKVGRVEVFHNGTWGTICDDSTNINFAKVVCRQLGYATDNVAVLPDAYYGAGTGPIWLDDVICQGNESVINLCMFRPWGQHNCGHGDDVGVACIACSVPDVTDASKDTGAAIVYHTTVTYTCAGGHSHTQGNLVRTCQADGQLDGTFPTCTRDCGTVPSVPNSTYTTPTNTLQGAHVTYSCSSGYSATGTETIVCLTNGWTTRPVCHRDCGIVPSVPYSTYKAPTDTLLGARVTYSCNNGYTASGVETIVCFTSGWATRPVCHPVICSVPDVKDASKDSGATIVYNTAVTYTCDRGHIHTDGNLVRTCQTDGQLDGYSPTCTRDCGTVPAVPNSAYTVQTNTLLGARVTYSCNSGYTSSGAVTIACLTSGWATRPVCYPNCGTIPLVPNSTYTTPTNTLLGAHVTYSCNFGFSARDTETIVCLTNGWTTRPVCHPVICSVPDVTDASKGSGATIIYNTTVTYTCTGGHIHTDGNLVRTCQTDGQLDGNSPTCTRDCGTVPAVPYSTYTTPTNTLLGALVTYSCNSGYKSSGVETIVCFTSGWATRPVCHPDVGYDCTDTTCTDPNAVCDDATLLCSCPTGYFDSNGAALGGTCEFKSTEVSLVLIAVPIASVVVLILAVTTACFIKQRRNRLEANQGNSYTRISERNAISLQTIDNPAYVYTEGTPVAHVPQTNIDAAIIAQNYTDEHDYDTFQDLIYENTETNGEAIYENA
ncbi:deleted in malignant brain tumors 1 protein-like [Mya arenaria]|uniref:deleted in malignant brain tumors 1 protein-like n=1 Tax=Mya arenaria TaxID=6604 RepID=UPI0022E28EEF|nr:deleted in malignant brain tumors 1 protein-like [Mya arenaria]